MPAPPLVRGGLFLAFWAVGRKGEGTRRRELFKIARFEKILRGILPMRLFWVAFARFRHAFPAFALFHGGKGDFWSNGANGRKNGAKSEKSVKSKPLLYKIRGAECVEKSPFVLFTVYKSSALAKTGLNRKEKSPSKRQGGKCGLLFAGSKKRFGEKQQKKQGLGKKKKTAKRKK